jgi:Glycosyl hydrolase family 99
MYANRAKSFGQTAVAISCMLLLLVLSACQNSTGQSSLVAQKGSSTRPAPRVESSPVSRATPINIQVANQNSTPTPKPTAAPTQGTYNPTIIPGSYNPNRPVLAFYYTWYSPTTWCSCQMPDLPTILYNSNDASTIQRQVTWAASAGITGFISSWWGPGGQTDTNFAHMLAYSATLQASTGYHFDSSIYFESDSPGLNSTASMISALRYVTAHYVNNPNFFHWNGKPVLFFWDPLGGGRTLATWSYIRSQVDPNNQMIWSAEGVSMSLLSVFDGIHLFSAGYWGIQHGDMTAVDQGFRNEITAYNSANHTQKIWAAGVFPGFNDTKVPGRTGTFIVDRNNGQTYQQSWAAATASSPDWITITSFNEWFEGSMIEPSVTYGTLYLSLTQQYARGWHG